MNKENILTLINNLIILIETYLEEIFKIISIKEFLNQFNYEIISLLLNLININITSEQIYTTTEIISKTELGLLIFTIITLIIKIIISIIIFIKKIIKFLFY